MSNRESGDRLRGGNGEDRRGIEKHTSGSIVSDYITDRKPVRFLLHWQHDFFAGGQHACKVEVVYDCTQRAHQLGCLAFVYVELRREG